MKTLYLAICALGLVMPISAQTMNSTVELEVSGAPADDLTGQIVNITHTGYGVNYGDITLDTEGHATFKVYPGTHSLTICRAGYIDYLTDFEAIENDKIRLGIQLTENVQKPATLTAEYDHNVFTGKGSVSVTWNMEPDVFFDDFESYEPFAIEFGDWTGLDLDNDMAAPLVGSYPNRGEKQYATIVNPLTVEPAWWYDYPILRPYSGKQYAGFIRTNSGVANNDWLITPVITPGNGNVFEFFAKSADIYNEKFQVYVTTKTNQPSVDDFVKISEANYETTSYKGWKRFTYDISGFEGVPVKFAVRYMSSANNGGAFMMMIDDVRVGKPALKSSKSRRANTKSPANPNEKFEITLNDKLIATTDEYSYVIDEVEPNRHTIGVTAVYLNSRSEEAQTEIDMSEMEVCNLAFTMTVPEGLAKTGGEVTLTSTDTGKSVTSKYGDDMKAIFPYLPYGEYSAEITAGTNYAETELTVIADKETLEIGIDLKERIVTPMNLATACDKTTGDVTLTWNRNTAFTDSFEDYGDFVQNSFGDWLGINLDQHITYPIQLNGYIINYPGASTTQNPAAVGPVVFNAWETSPAMLPADQAMNPPTGSKQILMFSPQQNGSNKWIVSPAVEVMDGYMMRITAKSYDATYPESLEFGVTTNLDGDVKTMNVIATAEKMPSDQWTIYEVPLDDYAGQTVRIGIHHVSYDTFFAQLDDFYVGNGQAAGEEVETGNVIEYEIYLDGSLNCKTTGTEAVLKGLDEGEHTLGVAAVYATGRSEMATVTVNVTASIEEAETTSNTLHTKWFRPDGTEVAEPQTPGIYIKNYNGKSIKIRI